MRDLTNEDIDPNFAEKVYTQTYEKKTVIEGVQVIQLKNMVGEDGDFSEMMRFTHGELDAIPGFKIAQINRTRLYSQSIKAWHMHYKQDEIWFISPKYHLIVGLWDTRKDSPTCGIRYKFGIGSGNSNLIYIPRGVAHGSANASGTDVEMFYFVNRQFDINDPDERRIPWDTLGADFWNPERD